MPSRVRRCAGSVVMSRPSKTIRPSSAWSEPDTQLMSVVLPEPLGPIRPKRSPGFTCSVTRLSAVKPPKRLTTPFTSSSAALVDFLDRPWRSNVTAPHAAQQPENAFRRHHDEGDQHDPYDEQVQLGR